MSSGYGWTVVRHDLKDQLDEMGGIVRQLLLEPEQADDSSYAHLLAQNIGELLAGIEHLFAAIIGDGADEGGGLANFAGCKRFAVVAGNFGHLGLLELHNHAFGQQHLVYTAHRLAIIIE